MFFDSKTHYTSVTGDKTEPGYLLFYRHDQLHRTDGPARQFIQKGVKYGNKFYLFGKEYTEEEHRKAIQFLKEQGEDAFISRYS